MKIVTAQKSGLTSNYDRVGYTTHGAVVLDGASSFGNTQYDTGEYVDILLDAILKRLHTPEQLKPILAQSIQHTADLLRLTPGASPSATVAIARQQPTQTEFLVLGDAQIVGTTFQLRDDRLDTVGTSHRTKYRQRLEQGHGYDNIHQKILADLQADEAKRRNTPGGFWVAEANPSAAQHALDKTIKSTNNTKTWFVMSTDGAYSTLGHLGLDSWKTISEHTEDELAELLNQCHDWEEKQDPHGQTMPRAKRHDDKTLAVVQCVSPSFSPCDA